MTLQAGAAVRDISPVKPMFLVGYPHVERISEGIHDPLLATALCLNNRSTAIILVALDILFIDPPTARELRARISDSAGIPEANVFVSCTHTHSGPVTMDMISWREDPVAPRPDPEYMRMFKTRIIEAARAAADSLRPAEIAWTAARIEGVGCNRLSPDGPRDPETGILAVRAADTRKLLALSVTYSMHPTVLHEDSRLVSSDFPHFARAAMRETLGADLSVLYHTGPAGNQSPRYHVKGQTFEEAERLGRRLGVAAVESVSKLQNADFVADPSIGAALASATLPRKHPPSLVEAEFNLKKRKEEYERLKRENAGHGPARTAECAIFGAEESLALARAEKMGEIRAFLESYIPIEVQALRIGNACLAGLPGEVFVEYALELKKRAPMKTFVVSLVNGELQGYVVTPAAAAAGGYEAANGLFAPEAGRILVDTALALMESL